VKYDVLVYGPLFCDLIFTGLPDMPELGKEIFATDFKVTIGGSAIVAVALHRLGAKVGLIAELGNDPISRLAGIVLDDYGIDRTLIRQHDRPLSQVTVALSFPHDRAFVTRFERPDTPPDFAHLLREHPARHLHLSGYMALQETPTAAQMAHEAGLTVSLDSGWDAEALRDCWLRDALGAVDVFMPSRSELCWMSGEDEPDRAQDAMLALMADSGVLVMKDGARGAVACGRGWREHAPPIAVTPIDTTGAGDSFDAGFIFAWIQGLPLTTCLRYGAICGGLTTTAVGGASAAPTYEEVQKWL